MVTYQAIAILLIVSEFKYITRKEVSNILNMNYANASRLIQKLIKDNLLIEVDKGVITINTSKLSDSPSITYILKNVKK